MVYAALRMNDRIVTASHSVERLWLHKTVFGRATYSERLCMVLNLYAENIGYQNKGKISRSATDNDDTHVNSSKVKPDDILHM
jgi:hypothetical protein